MKKILCLILIAALILPCINVFGATTYDWSSAYIYNPGGRHMPYRPADKSVSQQNPPSFTWPYVAVADTYDLKVCNEQEEVLFNVTGLKKNFYSFANAFTAGETYYWSVRYNVGGVASSWSEMRRFRIDTDATVFTVPDIETLMERVPSEHPRIWTTQKDLDSFRSLKDQNAVSREVYNKLIKDADLYVTEGYITTEPGTAGATTTVLGGTTEITTMLQTTAFAYLLTKEEKYGDFAVKVADALAGWSWEDGVGATSYLNQDQAHRMIAYKTAMAYDWIYDVFQQNENTAAKEKVLNMIKERTERMIYLIIPDENMENGHSIEESPYDSHGWTALGYIGIIGLAMKGDIPEADEWLRNSIPLYAAIVTPWSEQDGGWSQGTEYWKYSIESQNEFAEVMALAGVINLYNTASIRNSYLWGLYAYPNGSYGSFGDGNNNLAESDSYIGEAMGKIAYFTGNPAAKWLSEITGGLPIALESYYAGGNIAVNKEEPADYPLGHKFDDIGWVVMTDNVTNPGRIQMTFKSSPYGSYNHSHADQNSFYIQAFGEKLAVRSGYYDSYYSRHDKHITRRTFAHNSITLNNGMGQGDYPTDQSADKTDCDETCNHANGNFTHKGSLEQYVNGIYFDSVTGDATNAYKDSYGKYVGVFDGTPITESVDKFVRSIIYLRPDVFVVVDELDAKNDNTASFKWWLNAEGDKMTATNNSALISSGDARLQATVQYPANTTKTEYDGFVDLLGNTWEASGTYATLPVHDRVSFATPEVDKTKMVVTMSVYEKSGTSKQPKTETFEEYMKLSFDDGSCVMINLKPDNSNVETNEGIIFEGSAVTYNDEAIMLTNGRYLEKDGQVLIDSLENVTASIGNGQFAFSSNNDTTLKLLKNNGYSNLTEVDELTDIKERQLSSSIGVVAEDDGDVCNIKADKGDYTILINDDGVENIVEMIPQNIKIAHNESENKLYVSWSERQDYCYDIKINGVIQENVRSPYVTEINSGVSTYSVSLRARKGNLQSEWSGNSVYSCDEPDSYSYVTFAEIEKNGETYIRAKSYITKPEEGGKWIIAAVSDKGVLTDVETADMLSGSHTLDIKKAGSDGTVKCYMWNMDSGLTPLTCVAEYKSDSTELCGIYLNNKLIPGFDETKNSYSVDICEGEYTVFPKLSAVAKDNSSKVVTEVALDGKSAIIEVIAANGNNRKININFNFVYEDIHRVANADNAELFQVDSGVNMDSEGNSGTVSKNPVAKLSYNDAGISKSIDMNLYSKTRKNQGGTYFGSRYSGDRPTNSVSYTEIAELDDSLIGWDYFVLPKTDFTDSASEYTDEKMTFTLKHDAEIVVVSAKDMNALTAEGFSTEIGNFGTARYWNAVGDEDVYYNVDLLGRDASEVTGKNVLTSYDYADLWVNVEPINNMTLAEYREQKIDKTMFTVVSSSGGKCRKYIQNYSLRRKYTKVFSAGEVSIDLSDDAGRIIVIIKPIEPKPYISNIRYLGPVNYSDIPSELKIDVVDNDAQQSVAFYNNGLITGIFANGSKAWIDRENSIGRLLLKEDLLSVEGAYYIAPSFEIHRGSSGYRWQKAYYYGLSNVSGNSYPKFENMSHDWIGFDLNTSAYLYIAVSGKAPMFIDETWEKVDVGGLEFSTMDSSDNLKQHGLVYKKYISVTDDEPISVVMKTPGTGSVDNYYLIIKPFVDKTEVKS